MNAAPYNPATRRPGHVYRLMNGPGLVVGNVTDLQANASDMSVPAVICTPAIDREDEVIIPDGVVYGNYARNPVVLWEHGFASEVCVPIAKSEDPNGRLTITKSQNRIDAVAYFTDKHPISYQMFGLIEAKLVRATSIHVIPAPGTTQIKSIDGKRVTVYPHSDLLEWSFGCLGVNPESIAKILRIGKIGNEQMNAGIRKCLLPYMPRPRGNGVGADFTRPAKTPNEAFRKWGLAAFQNV